MPDTLARSTARRLEPSQKAIAHAQRQQQAALAPAHQSSTHESNCLYGRRARSWASMVLQSVHLCYRFAHCDGLLHEGLRDLGLRLGS